MAIQSFESGAFDGVGTGQVMFAESPMRARNSATFPTTQGLNFFQQSLGDSITITNQGDAGAFPYADGQHATYQGSLTSELLPGEPATGGSWFLGGGWTRITGDQFKPGGNLSPSTTFLVAPLGTPVTVRNSSGALPGVWLINVGAAYTAQVQGIFVNAAFAAQNFSVSFQIVSLDTSQTVDITPAGWGPSFANTPGIQFSIDSVALFGRKTLFFFQFTLGGATFGLPFFSQAQYGATINASLTTPAH